MATPFLVSVDREQVTPVVTLSLSKPDTFLSDYLSNLSLTFDSPAEAVLEDIVDDGYKPRTYTLVPSVESERRRFLSPQYTKFAPVSNASRLANPEMIAAAVDRAVDRARGVV